MSKRKCTRSELELQYLYLQSQFSDIFSEESILLQHFPAEIWLAIFSKASAESLEILSKSSAFFNSLLRPFRTQFLFPKVLKTMLPYIPEFDTPEIFESCRTVCRFWNEGVKQILQDESQHTDIQGTKYGVAPPPPAYFDIFRECFDSINTIKQFDHHFDVTHAKKNANPFASRYLEINAVGYGLRRNFLVPLNRVQEKWGNHVWYCEIVFLFLTDMDFTKLCHILKLLPNLKVLSLTVQRDVFPRFTNQAGLLPALPNLVGIKLTGFQYPGLLKALIKNNRHIKSLVVDEKVPQHLRRSKFTSGYDILFEKPMPKLEQLEIHYHNFKELSKLRDMRRTWPLRKLVLDLSNTDEIGENIKSCFQTLEQKFSGTLQELYLRFPKSYNGGYIGTLCLPSLHTLFLEVSTWVPMDFILPMKSNLRVLGVRLVEPRTVMNRPEGCIKFFTVCCDLDLLHSNIWNLFPKLEQIAYFQQAFNQLDIYERSQLEDTAVENC